MRNRSICFIVLISFILSACNSNNNQDATSQIDEVEDITDSVSGDGDEAITDIVEITQEEAITDSDIQACKNVALSNAGIQEDSVIFEKIIRYRSHNTHVCELIFYTDSNKYVYKINIDSHDILFAKIVTIDNSTDIESVTTNENFISSDEALSIAISYANISQSSIVKQKVELDDDHNQWYYEIEIKTSNDVKYEFTISATSGSIIEFEIKD